jgi:hypothetical protein
MVEPNFCVLEASRILGQAHQRVCSQLDTREKWNRRPRPRLARQGRAPPTRFLDLGPVTSAAAGL